MHMHAQAHPHERPRIRPHTPTSKPRNLGQDGELACVDMYVDEAGYLANILVPATGPYHSCEDLADAGICASDMV